MSEHDTSADGQLALPGLRDAVREAVAASRASRDAHQRAEQAVERPTGKTPAERNERRLDAILQGALPRKAGGALQRILDRTLQTLYGDCGFVVADVRALLLERRDLHRIVTTPVENRVADALAVLSEIVTACEEPIDASTASAISDAGMSGDAMLTGRVAAHARRSGGQSAGRQRVEEARADHDRWEKAARAEIANGTPLRNVAAAVADRYGVTPRAVRDALQARDVLSKRK